RRSYFPYLLVAIGLLVALGAPAWVWTQMQVWRQKAQEVVAENTPDDQLETGIRVQMGELESQIQKYHTSVGKIADRAAAAQVRGEERQRQRDEEKKALSRIKRMLDEDAEPYRVGPRSYTREELKADGLARLNRCKALEEQVANQRKLTEQLEAGLN